MSDTNLQIHREETQVSCLWRGIELNNLKKQTRLYEALKKRMT